MDSDVGKLFIGGIAWDTTEERLRDYFSKYGEVSLAVIMRDKTTGQPRGFGFVVFSDPSVLDAVLQEKHTIDGRSVEAKRALSREQQQSLRSENPQAGKTTGNEGNFRTKKIFVGGLPSTLTEEEFGQYFQSYGNVSDVVIMYDQNTSRPRGFGFITFESEDAVDRVLHKSFHEIKNKLVEVKKALPKEANPSGGGRGGGYSSHAPSGPNARGVGGRTESNSFLQPQPALGGYPQYPSYGTPTYGYGMANTTMGYGAYGGYGLGGYGTGGAGFASIAGAYGNPSGPGTGYMTGSAAAMKNQWSSQTPGFGGSGYCLNPSHSPADGSNYSGQGQGRSYTGSAGYGTVGGGRRSGHNNAGGGASDAGHRNVGGSYTGRTYGSSNGSSGYSEPTWGSES